MREFLTIEEAAAHFLVSPQVIRKWINRGELPAFVRVSSSLSGPHPLHHQDEEQSPRCLLGSSTTLERDQ